MTTLSNSSSNSSSSFLIDFHKALLSPSYSLISLFKSQKHFNSDTASIVICNLSYYIHQTSATAVALKSILCDFVFEIFPVLFQLIMAIDSNLHQCEVQIILHALTLSANHYETFLVFLDQLININENNINQRLDLFIEYISLLFDKIATGANKRFRACNKLLRAVRVVVETLSNKIHKDITHPFTPSINRYSPEDSIVLYHLITLLLKLEDTNNNNYNQNYNSNNDNDNNNHNNNIVIDTLCHIFPLLIGMEPNIREYDVRPLLYSIFKRFRMAHWHVIYKNTNVGMASMAAWALIVNEPCQLVFPVGISVESMIDVTITQSYYLLSHSILATNVVGLRLLNAVFVKFPNFQLDFILTEKEPTIVIMFKRIINIMTMFSEECVRKKSVITLRSFCEIIPSDIRWNVLRVTILDCPYIQVSALLLDFLRAFELHTRREKSLLSLIITVSEKWLETSFSVEMLGEFIISTCSIIRLGVKRSVFQHHNFNDIRTRVVNQIKHKIENYTDTCQMLDLIKLNLKWTIDDME